MATFHIHQDQSEKENAFNAAHHGKPQQKNNQDLKEKRPTLTVRGQQGNITASNQLNKVVTTTNNEKHVYSANFQQQKIATSKTNTIKTTTEHTAKPFVVYEDVQTKSLSTTDTTAAVPNEELQANDQRIATKNIEHNACATRNPLKEIRDDLTETPMSVSEVFSPMSVDKSACHIDDTENLAPNISLPKSSKDDNDRFFEVDEYQLDILKYYGEIEQKHRPKPNYMKRQPDINNSMRTILVDWLVEVSEEYRLHTETLYLAVSYIDRFLSYMSVVRAKLQLVGTAAMFIAAKFEEIYPPDVGEFVFITDDTYTKAQVLRMEQIIVKILSFDLNVPSPPVFLNTYAVLYEVPDQVKYLTFYLSELTLLEGEPYLQYLPSEISSAALALSRYILNYPIWCQELESTTKYTLEQLQEIILNICHLHNSSLKLAQQAIQEKYKASKYMHVSTIKPVKLTEDQLNYLIKSYNGSKMKKVKDNESLSNK